MTMPFPWAPALFVLDNLFVLYAAFVFISGIHTKLSWHKVALYTVALALCVIVAICLILGSAGLLTSRAILATCAILALACHLSRRTGIAGPALTIDGRRFVHFTYTTTTYQKYALLILALFFGCIFFRSVFGPTRFVYDDLSYHAPVVAHWLADSGLSLSPHNYHQYFPFNSELISLWLEAAFMRDGVSNLAGPLFVLVALFAIVSISRHLGHGVSTALLVCAVFISSRVVQQSTITFSSTDMAGPAFILASIAAVFEREHVIDRKARFRFALLAGLFCGFAIGTKIIFLPASLAILGYILFTDLRVHNRASVLPSCIAFLAMALSIGAFWYVRTWLITGNPLYPAELGPFAGPFEAEQQARTKLSYWFVHHFADKAFWMQFVENNAHWPLIHFVLVVVAYVAALLRYARRAGGYDRPANLAFLLILGLLVLLVWLNQPFAATANSPDAQLGSGKRYIILWFAIGALLWGNCLEHKGLLGKLSFYLTIAALTVGWSSDWTSWGGPALSSKENILQSAGSVAVGVLVVLCFERGSPIVRALARRPQTTLALSAVLLVGLVALWEPFKHRQTSEQLFADWPELRPLSRLEQLAPGSKIAWTGPLPGYYPLFGRSFQLVPVAVDADGRPAAPMHERERTVWWDQPADGAALSLSEGTVLANLAGSEIHYVLRYRANPDEPPGTSDAAVANDPRITVLWRDGHFDLYAIPAGGPTT